MLSDVIRAVMPQAVALAPAVRGEDRPVAWVRVMRARVPAFDALETGDLVIVPASALASVVQEPTDAEHMAEELARAAVAGVVIVPQSGATDAAGWPGAAAALAERLAAGGTPSFRLIGTDEVALERAAIAFLVNERAELDRQVARLEADVQAIALEGRGLAEMAAAIAAFARRAVAIEDPEGAIVALHAPPDLPASTVLAARYERRRGPIALRVGLPGGGALVLLGDDAGSDLETAAVGRVAVLVALELARGPAGRRRPARATEGLPAGGPPWVVLMARQVLPDEDATLAEREQRRERVTRLAPARRLLLRGDATSIELRAVVAAVPDDPLALELAGRIGRLLGRPVAASRPFGVAAGRPAADAEARALLEAADELAALEAPPAVLRADRLALYRLLGSLHNLPDGERHARALLAPLLSGAPRAQRERLATLRSALDGAGPAAAAAALGVHRNTIRYRLRAIEQRTGWDLDDAELRFVLSLALRLVRLAQE
jgi:hypothetical protein